ncbi:MAG: peptidylprolyl isomerase [Thermodesulfovibrionales bacterium]|jgi:peptidyl-prolyl cis-trans isomerase C
MKRFLAIVSLPVLLAGSLAWGGEPVVAKFPDKSYTFTDLERIMGYSNVWKTKISENSDPKLKSAVITRIIRAKAAADLARSKGLHKLPDIKEGLEVIINDFLSQEYVKREIADKVTVSDEEVRAYYDNNPKNFQLAEMVKVSHILISVDKGAPEGAKSKAREEAEAALKRIKAGEDFGKIAAEMSDDYQSSAKGGDLGFIARGKTVPEFEQAAFTLKPGEISGIIETPYGFQIIRVEEKQEARLEEFDKVKENIRTKKLTDAKKIAIEQFFIEILQGPGIQIEPTLLGGSGGHGQGGHGGHGGGH